MKSRYRIRNRDTISRSALIIVRVPSGAPSRVRHNDPVDDGNDLYSDRDIDTDERRDYEDQDNHIPQTSTANLGPYSAFYKTCLIIMI